jgi:site-specific recombinase XerD
LKGWALDVFVKSPVKTARRAADHQGKESAQIETVASEAVAQSVAENQDRRSPRGVFERPKGSGVWWICYHDSNGRKRREKAGTRGMAVKLYQKRKTEALQGKKLPESIRRKQVLLSELLDAAAEHIKGRYRGQRLGADGHDYRYAALKAALGNRPAEAVTAQEIERALSRLSEDRKWKPASFNRHKAFLSLAWRLGVESGKVQSSPVRLVHRRREDNGRIRWLSADEETKLRAVVEADYPAELPALDLALHTGMRMSEQYNLQWNCVDLERRQLTIPRSKHGGIRYIPLDNTALSALLTLRSRGDGNGPVMLCGQSGHGHLAGQALKTPKEWFGAACQKAGIADFAWHCLRHTFASRLVMAGVGLRKVQELMGHKTIAMTCRYAHLSPKHQLDAVLLLDGWGRDSRNESDTKTDTSGLEAPGKRSVDNPQVTVQ